MKHTLFLFVILLGLFACQDDDTFFDIKMPEDKIRFEPIAGGAMMYYSLPAEMDVFGIRLRYKDCRGQEMLKVGDYGGDSLLLDGFNEARTNIPVAITLVNRRNEESEPINLEFDTKDSAPYTFFEKADVSSSWSGFQIVYDAPEQVSGMFHVFYLGENPLTREMDTILVKSSPIIKGGDTLLFPLETKNTINTVIVRTQDYKGYRVRQKIWEGVESFIPEKLDTSGFRFIDVKNLAIDNDEAKCGIKYLFDGDIKGEQRIKAGKGYLVHTFLAGPGATGAPFIIDLKKERVPAQVKIYTMLRSTSYNVPGATIFGPELPLADIWKAHYEDKIPCKVAIYGGDSEDPNGTWTKLGSFEQNRFLEAKDRWAYRSTADYDYKTLVSLEEAEPVCLEITFPTSSTTYRYLKLVVEETFMYYLYGYNPTDYNPARYVTMHELEVYVKK